MGTGIELTSAALLSESALYLPWDCPYPYSRARDEEM